MQSTAYGTVFTWIDAGGGSFTDADNWSPAGGPPNDGTDTAIFDLVGVYDVSISSGVTNNNFEVTAGNVTFDMFIDFNPLPSLIGNYTLDATSGGAAHIGSIPGSFFAAQLILNGSSFFSDPFSHVYTSSFLHIGRDALSGGILELNGRVHWNSTHISYIGLNGSGVLTLNGSSIMTNTLGIMGFGAGSFGTATIGGTWTNTDTLSVGFLGTGMLTIESNGTVNNDGDGQIAASGGSTGTVVVDNGTWNNNASLYVGGTSGGAGGTGELTMQTSGEVNVVIDMGVRTNGTVTINNGTLDVGGQLTLDAGSSLALVDGTINAGMLTGAANTMTWTTGAVNITAGDFAIDSNSPLGANESLGSGQSLSVSGTFQVGPTAAASVIVLFGATITSTDGVIGSNDPGVIAASVVLSEAGTDWTMTGDLTVGLTGINPAQLTIGQDAIVSNLDAFIADNVDAAADILVTFSGATWNNSGSMYLGGDASTLGGTGTLDVDNGGTVNVATTLKVWDNFIVSVDGGTITTPTLEVLGTVNYVGTLDLSGIGDVGALVLAGGTVNANVIDFADQSFSGFGALNGEVIVGGDVTATGNLTMGDASSFAGVQIDGALDVGTHTVTIHKKGFFNIGTSTIITGGTLTVPNGVAIPVGNGLAAFGTIDGRVVAQSGSTIEATGSLTLGDATSPAGFFSDGELSLGANTVTLLDANEAVLGSLTTLGDGVLPGTLVAANGAVLEFGKNIIGFGTVDTPNDPFKPLTNNGNIAGDDPNQLITLTGYVKGVGTLDNVVITGTDAPGFSAATVYRGSVTYAGTLEIEIGGLTAGDFDTLIHSGTATLGGTLDLSLINDFTPTAGDIFEIITATSILGTFTTETLPALAGGLEWFVNYSDTAVELISTFAGDFDFDGDVDGFDFLAWQRGESPIPLSQSNLADWEANYGAVAPLAAASTAVPEPGTCIGLLIGMMALLFRRGAIVS